LRDEKLSNSRKVTEALFKINIDVSEKYFLRRSEKSESSVKRKKINKVLRYQHKILGIENTSNSIGPNCILYQKSMQYLILLPAGGC